MYFDSLKYNIVIQNGALVILAEHNSSSLETVKKISSIENSWKYDSLHMIIKEFLETQQIGVKCYMPCTAFQNWLSTQSYHWDTLE